MRGWEQIGLFIKLMSFEANPRELTAIKGVAKVENSSKSINDVGADA